MIVGVDGCKRGWFAVSLPDPMQYGVYPTIEAVWSGYQDATAIWIDIPIGIADDNQRACESGARKMIGARRSSVFSVPVRAALDATTYTEASAINCQITGKKLSKQTWNIMPKIREVDTFLRSNPAAQPIFYEMHPEVVFCALAGAPMPYAKKYPSGFDQRVAILEQFYPGARELIAQAYADHRHELVQDDVVDALVGAVAAGMGHFATLPAHPPADRYGLPMRIVYPEKPD